MNLVFIELKSLHAISDKFMKLLEKLTDLEDLRLLLLRSKNEIWVGFDEIDESFIVS